MLVIRTNVAATDTTLPVLRRDTVLDAANDGVLGLFDLASSFSWAKQAAPANADTVKDLAEKGDFTVDLNAGQAIAYSGRGFDLSGITSKGSGCCIKGPASIAAGIRGDGSVNQYFLIAMYLKLPSQSDWNTSATLAPFLSWGSAAGYGTEADVVTITQLSSGQINARRQTALNVIATSAITLPVGAFGQFAQIGFWRNATEQGLRVKTAATSSTAVPVATGSNNSVDFSATRPRFGIGPNFWSAATPMITEHLNAGNFRIYRAWIENLRLSARDPLTVLDADWTRTTARAVFS